MHPIRPASSESPEEDEAFPRPRYQGRPADPVKLFEECLKTRCECEGSLASLDARVTTFCTPSSGDRTSCGASSNILSESHKIRPNEAGTDNKVEVADTDETESIDHSFQCAETDSTSFQIFNSSQAEDSCSGPTTPSNQPQSPFFDRHSRSRGDGGSEVLAAQQQHPCSLSLTLVPPVLDSTASLMKYRVKYPFLLANLRRALLCDRVAGDAANILDSFAEEVLDKRRLKSVAPVPLVFPVQSPTGVDPFEDLITEGLRFRKHQWKCHYYALIDAVDLLYKDYQLLSHINRDGSRTLATCSPFHVISCYSDPFAFQQTQNDESRVMAGIDPVNYLVHLLSKHLPCMEARTHVRQDSVRPLSPGKGQRRRHQSASWAVLPAHRFFASVAFIQDVIAQCRLIHLELEKQLAFQTRAMHIIRQAKEQKVQLEACMVEQKQKIFKLADTIKASRQELEEMVAKSVASKRQQKQQAETTTATARLDSSGNDAEPHTLAGKRKRLEDLRRTLVGKTVRLAALERVLREEETRRRRLHNRLQEINGNIRVFCRVRPSANESHSGVAGGVASYIRVASDDKLLICPDALPDTRDCRSGALLLKSLKSNHGPDGMRCFIFDKVFGPDAKQSTVYREVDDLVISCVDGYNVCIIAYGQTGSGKTHTMVGTQEEPGVNRRAIQRLLRLCNDRHHWEYRLSMSMLEVYQEEVFDLLDSFEPPIRETSAEQLSRTSSNEISSHPSNSRSSNSIQSNRSRSTAPSSVSGCTQKPTPAGFITACGINSFAQPRPSVLRRRSVVKLLSTQEDELVLQNLTERPIMTERDVLDCLNLGEQRRSVGATQLNRASSRSHLILLLRVSGEHRLHRNHSRGTLILADLAGSENVTKSGSVGQRLQEAACINRSLCCLGRVFDALRRREKPAYRETKLTYLLKPTLGGDSKCLLFINVRGEPEHADETLRAINFGQNALQVAPWKSASSHKSVGVCGDGSRLITHLDSNQLPRPEQRRVAGPGRRPIPRKVWDQPPLH
ncbi:unnamed protein product [Schistocephalus solidus]|uniref:Kinesin-4 n=1 Tax=Schistocephalus solidus TaxID=70667 RepID=A0A183SJ17_SCHSO|nr:unnamed protein product [Schistocephalus solidus]